MLTNVFILIPSRERKETFQSFQSFEQCSKTAQATGGGGGRGSFALMNIRVRVELSGQFRNEVYILLDYSEKCYSFREYWTVGR